MRFSEDDLHRFAAWSGDRNPLHVDAAFARSTPFGQPIVHGMLSVLEALDATRALPDAPLASVEIEFRGAVVQGVDYQVEFTRADGALDIAVRVGDSTLLNVRAASGQTPGAEPAADLAWATDLVARGVTPPSGFRLEPASPTTTELERGVEIVRSYQTDATNGVMYGRADGRRIAAEVLALCSYLVGMELPGLRSLFTRARIQFASPIEGNAMPSAFWYRARSLRFDRHFRILDAQVDIVTPDARPIATAVLRSYVPFGQSPIDLDALAGTLAPAARRLDGLVALVCGGSRGLGADIGAALALAGCHVYVGARGDADAIADLSRRLDERGRRLEFAQGDVGDAAWCQRTLETIRGRHGRLDLLVLNACSAPASLRIGPEAFERHAEYVRNNLRLVETPLAMFLAALDESGGTVAYVSSSFVEDPPPGLSHYVALKQAAEGLVRAARRESSRVSALIARPPRLQTSWNDTPTGVAGAIPTSWAALHIVNELAETAGSARVEVVSAFPAPAGGSTKQDPPYARSADARRPGPVRGTGRTFPIRLCASFTTDPLLPGLRFWLDELGVEDGMVVAPYGQVLQTLLDPSSAFTDRGGFNVVLVRVRDWLRELSAERAESIDFVRGYLQDTARDLERAVRAHRARAAAETLLLFCPSYGAASSAESILLRQTETDLIAALDGVPGLHVARAADLHPQYRVDEDQVSDPIREKIAHIPYRDAYYHTLATIITRHAHRKLAAPRKVVVVDCDNTLWRGVVGEVGAEGIEIDAGHHALHDTLTRLVRGGVLVCLCSKNEEADVWRVFETRADLRLTRGDVVAAAINWQPKPENLTSLAARLNLGLDSFIFIDDNPVECAQVRAGCPEVLTLQWPLDSDRAQRLLEHTWELDSVRATAEDQRRTEMYREEFRRQELRDDTLTFADFIANLDLHVDIAALGSDDLRRASQLTLRTNQFNFTTRRRDESELQALLAAGGHDVRTIRVRDRFGDYGLVGLIIAEPQADVLLTDTFLLSCRVLGRGAEHRIAAELGRLALARGLRAVRMRVETTKRNTPARKFLESIAPEEGRRGDEQALEYDFPAAALAALRFEADAQPAYVPAGEDSGAHASSDVGRVLPVGPAEQLRQREAQIARAAYELSDPAALAAAIARHTDAGSTQQDPAYGSADARRQDPAYASPDAGRVLPVGPAVREDVSAVVYTAFATALRVPVSKVQEVDGLEALGCDSMRIVEITVSLLDKYPWLPSTLLFEHRSVSAIIREISGLAGRASLPESAGSAIAGSREQGPAYVPRRPGSAADIAVVGMHVRVAGANSPDELWELLSAGRSAVREVNPHRPHFLHPLSDTRPHWAGLLDDVARFDPEFFGISPREAELMDPQLRLFLEVAWSALEDAGCAGSERDPNTGVFVGVMYGDYGQPANIAATMTGNPYRSWEGFSLANRTSQILGFGGPSLAVDTACSSSGTALHLAVQAINAGDCRAAIVGGVNLILNPDRFGSLGRLGILSTRGRCEPFGADADGTVLGEGAGAVLLRPLADARRRGDRIYGVIKGTGLSTGSGTVGFTAPNPQAQAEAIERSLRMARIDPRTISYVETHGTGTVLGDPIEVRGLTLAYSKSELFDPALDVPLRCRLGSIKPNIGHLEAGAGIVGLIKVLLQMNRGMLVPSITSAQPNPHIPGFGVRDSGFGVQRGLEPWEQPAIDLDGSKIVFPRRAGLSSFGVGGANAHVIVEEPPVRVQAARRETERPAHVLALSARTESSVRRQAAALRAHLDVHPEMPLADTCFTANVGRQHFEHRLALPVTNRDQLLAALGDVADGRTPAGALRGEARPGSPPKIAFLFTGQGSQYVGMGRGLYETQPVFRDALDRCAAIFDRLLGQPLLDLLFASEDSPESALLNQTGFTQPALFAFEYSLVELWRSWGITPDIVMGHSVGELAAICVAGGVSLDDGLKLIAARGRLMQALPPGGTMTSVMANEGRVQEAITGSEDLVAIAAINAPEQVVISGAGVAVARVTARLEADGIKTKPLTVSHAFHSPLMRPMVAEYEAVVREVTFTAPRIPFVSCVDGVLAGDEVTRPEYWVRNVTDPVRFTAGMQALEAANVRTFIEIGPQPVLLGMGRQCVGDPAADLAWLPSLRKDVDPWQTMLAALARVYVDGAMVDWTGFDAPYARQTVSLPPYSFNEKSYWLPRGLAGSTGQDPASVVTDGTLANIYSLVWREQPIGGHRSPEGRQASARWLIFADDKGLGLRVAELLAAGHRQATLVFPGEHYGTAWDGNLHVNPEDARDFEQLWQTACAEGAPPSVVYLWGLDGPPTSGTNGATAASRSRGGLTSALHLVQAVAKSRHAGSRVWFVTRSAVDAGAASTPIAVAQATLWGFGRTVALEHPDFWGGVIDVGGDADSTALTRELLDGDGNDQVALRGDHRYVARLRRGLRAPSEEPSNPRTFAPSHFSFDPSGTYLITGGTGALGLQVASWAIARGARHLVLTTRQRTTSAATDAALARLRAAGSEVVVATADAASAADVDALIGRIASGPSPLRGVIHAAGIDTPVPLRRMTQKDLDATLAPKADGAWLLHERTRDIDLDLFVCFSSMASILGSQGRAHYGAANAYLDALVLERRRLGLSGLSVNWGPWQGGGMAGADQLDQFARIGNHGLEPDAAFEALDRLLTAGADQAMVADVEWSRFRESYEARGARPLVSELRDTGPRTHADAGPRTGRAGPLDPPERKDEAAPWRARLLDAAESERESTLTSLLRAETASTLGFESANDVPLDRPFSTLGMDSLMTAEFIGRLGKCTGLSCSALVFDHPSVRALAPKLLEALGTGLTNKTGSADVAGSEEQAVETRQSDADILAFQTAVFPDRNPDLIVPRWRWMFDDSATRLGRESQTWLHFDAGRLVGHMGAIPVRLKIGAGERDTAWLVDTMVLESHRPQAIGSRLMLRAHEDLPFSLSLGQSPEMREIQFRLGWKEVATLQVAQLLIRPENVLKRKLGTPGAWAAGLGLRTWAAVRGGVGARPRLSPREITRFDGRHDALWETMARDVVCGVVRDASFLNWKYVDQPGQRFVRLDAVDGMDVVRGSLVLAIREPDTVYSYRRAFLLDVLAPLRDEMLLEQLLHFAAEAAAAHGADSLVFMHTDPRLTRAANACGFHLREPKRVVLIDTGGLAQPELALLSDAGNWYVTQGDSDIDRPGVA